MVTPWDAGEPHLSGLSIIKPFMAVPDVVTRSPGEHRSESGKTATDAVYCIHRIIRDE